MNSAPAGSSVPRPLPVPMASSVAAPAPTAAVATSAAAIIGAPAVVAAPVAPAPPSTTAAHAHAQAQAQAQAHAAAAAAAASAAASASALHASMSAAALNPLTMAPTEPAPQAAAAALVGPPPPPPAAAAAAVAGGAADASHLYHQLGMPPLLSSSVPPVGSSVLGVADLPTSKPRGNCRGKWTAAEDEMLRNAVVKHNGKSWKKIAACLNDRTDVQCLHRWQKVLKPGLVKGPWTKEEDALLIRLVEQFGCKKWSHIASFLHGRLGKQCRERWYNHLNPDINKGPWTSEEDHLTITMQLNYKNKWALIAREMKGRTDNAIKNRWNSTLGRVVNQWADKIIKEQDARGVAGVKAWLHEQHARHLADRAALLDSGEVKDLAPALPPEPASKDAAVLTLVRSVRDTYTTPPFIPDAGFERAHLDTKKAAMWLLLYERQLGDASRGRRKPAGGAGRGGKRGGPADGRRPDGRYQTQPPPSTEPPSVAYPNVEQHPHYRTLAPNPALSAAASVGASALLMPGHHPGLLQRLGPSPSAVDAVPVPEPPVAVSRGPRGRKPRGRKSNSAKALLTGAAMAPATSIAAPASLAAANNAVPAVNTIAMAGGDEEFVPAMTAGAGKGKATKGGRGAKAKAKPGPKPKRGPKAGAAKTTRGRKPRANKQQQQQQHQVGAQHAAAEVGTIADPNPTTTTTTTKRSGRRSRRPKDDADFVTGDDAELDGGAAAGGGGMLTGAGRRKQQQQFPKRIQTTVTAEDEAAALAAAPVSNNQALDLLHFMNSPPPAPRPLTAGSGLKSPGGPPFTPSMPFHMFDANGGTPGLLPTPGSMSQDLMNSGYRWPQRSPGSARRGTGTRRDLYNTAAGGMPSLPFMSPPPSGAMPGLHMPTMSMQMAMPTDPSAAMIMGGTPAGMGGFGTPAGVRFPGGPIMSPSSLLGTMFASPMPPVPTPEALQRAAAAAAASGAGTLPPSSPVAARAPPAASGAPAPSASAAPAAASASATPAAAAATAAAAGASGVPAETPKRHQTSGPVVPLTPLACISPDTAAQMIASGGVSPFTGGLAMPPPKTSAGGFAVPTSGGAPLSSATPAATPSTPTPAPRPLPQGSPNGAAPADFAHVLGSPNLMQALGNLMSPPVSRMHMMSPRSGLGAPGGSRPSLMSAVGMKRQHIMSLTPKKAGVVKATPAAEPPLRQPPAGSAMNDPAGAAKDGMTDPVVLHQVPAKPSDEDAARAASVQAQLVNSAPSPVQNRAPLSSLSPTSAERAAAKRRASSGAGSPANEQEQIPEQQADGNTGPLKRRRTRSAAVLA